MCDAGRQRAAGSAREVDVRCDRRRSTLSIQLRLRLLECARGNRHAGHVVGDGEFELASLFPSGLRCRTPASALGVGRTTVPSPVTIAKVCSAPGPMSAERIEIGGA